MTENVAKHPLGSLSKAIEAGREIKEERLPRDFKEVGSFHAEEVEKREGRFSKVMVLPKGIRLQCRNSGRN